MIVLLPLRIDHSGSTARLLDQALTSAIARTTEKLTGSRPANASDPSPTPPVIATIRTTP